MKNTTTDNLIASLKAEIETLRTIISILPGNVYWQDKHGKYLGCNNNIAKTLQLKSPDEVIGKTNMELLGNDFAEKISVNDQFVIREQKGVHIEEHGFDSEGNPAIYLSQKSPFFDRAGKLQGLLGVSFDITDRKRMEQNLKIAKKKAEAANRAKSRFLATISHELRTPLTSILGFANLMEELEIKNSKEKEYIQHIAASGSYLLSLINNLLDYNRLETNNFELVHVPLNLRSLLQNIISMLDGGAKLKKIALRLNYPKTIPENIIGDNRVLQQIFINLVGNAIKFTEKGSVVIHVSQSHNTADSVKLHIAVEDTGVGIPKNEQKSVFKRFYQLGDVYTRQNSLTGTGLGLAIVKKLVKLMKGKIQLKSTIHVGSTFCITANFKKAPYQAPPLFLNEDSIKYITKAYVLLVEDDPVIQIVHKKMLENLGCKVDVAGTAHEALNLFKSNYDILFVDLGLPDIDGFRLIQLIREQDDTSSPLPIIALTGYSEEEERQRCLSVGANEVAIKPITKKILSDILKRCLIH